IIFLAGALIFSIITVTYIKTGKFLLIYYLLVGLPAKAYIIFAGFSFMSLIIFLLADRAKDFSNRELIGLALPLFFLATLFVGPDVPPESFLNRSLAGVFILFYSLILGLLGIRLSWPKLRITRALGYIFWLMFIAFVAIFGYLAVVKALSIYKAFDSSLYFQAMFNTLQGQWLKITCYNDSNNFLGIHFSPILALLAPLYLIWPSPFAFYLLQVLVVAGAVFPLKALAKKKLENRLLENLLGIAYLAYVPLSSVVLSEFREISFAIPAVIWAFYFLEINKKGWFVLSSLLAMACKEEMLVIYFLVGFFLYFFKKEKKLGVFLMGISTLTIFIYLINIVPHFKLNQSYHYLGKYYGNPFNLQGITERIFSFRSLQYFLLIFGPLLFTSFLSGGFIVTFLLTFLMTILSSYGNMASIYHWYSASLIPFVFIGSVYGLARRLTGSDTEAQDVTQQTFLSAVKNLSGFRGAAAFSTWLTTIAANAALKVVRKRRALPMTSLDEATEADDAGRIPHPEYIADWREAPDRLVQRAETHKLLDAAIAELDIARRAVFLLRDVEDISVKDTAKALGISE
ncbi:MAG: sigma-70 family RNA polymerase sigma factor, partial [Chrysiogenales bacterium]